MAMNKARKAAKKKLREEMKRRKGIDCPGNERHSLSSLAGLLGLTMMPPQTRRFRSDVPNESNGPSRREV